MEHTERQQAVIAAVENYDGERTKGGKPQLDGLADVLGFEIRAAERDAAIDYLESLVEIPEEKSAVLYTLSEDDERSIRAEREIPENVICIHASGCQYRAKVAEVMDGQVYLRVFLDGYGEYITAGREQGDGPGTYQPMP